jgi:hypothetical protein
MEIYMKGIDMPICIRLIAYRMFKGAGLYPNPTTGFIYLESSLAEAGQSKLIVLNAMGQQVNNMNIRFWAGIVEVDLSQLPNGIYFIWVFEEEGKRKEVVKVLKVEGS